MIKRYSRKEIAYIWEEENKYKIWLNIEVAAAAGMEKINLIPKGVASLVKKKGKIRIKRIHKGEQIKILIEEYAGLCKKYNVKPWSTSITPWRYSDPLVCPDLEYIFELADKYKFMVEMTTNGVSFTERNCKIIQKYLHTIDQITISIIGFSEKEIKKFMGVSWKVTEARLIKVKQKVKQKLK